MKTCWVCGGKLLDIRGKLVCNSCRTVNETCCDGGQQCPRPVLEQK